jgi:hypothetical protein
MLWAVVIRILTGNVKCIQKCFTLVYLVRKFSRIGVKDTVFVVAFTLFKRRMRTVPLGDPESTSGGITVEIKLGWICPVPAFRFLFFGDIGTCS